MFALNSHQRLNIRFTFTCLFCIKRLSTRLLAISIKLKIQTPVSVAYINDISLNRFQKDEIKEATAFLPPYINGITIESVVKTLELFSDRTRRQRVQY